MSDKFSSEEIHMLVNILSEDEFYELRKAVSERITRENVRKTINVMGGIDHCPMRVRYKSLGIEPHFEHKAPKERVLGGSNTLYGG